MEAYLTSSLRNSHLEPVVKSVMRVPMPMTRSASCAILLEAEVPVTPMPPRQYGWPDLQALLPPWVSPKGMLKVSQNCSTASPASE